VPEYRLDIINEQDIIEDIAIAYGYEYINPVPVPSIGAGVLESRESLFEKASEALVGMGFSEAMNSYLSNSATNFAKMSRKPAEDEAVTIKDAKSANIEMLRTALLPSLLSNLSLSRHEKMPQRMFELDMAFHVKDKRPVESYHAAAVSLDSSSNFNYSKSVVTALLHVLGAAFDVKAATDPSFIDGRCAAVVAKGKQIGVFGELHPRVLRSFGIEEPAVAFEIDLTTLY
jgi:phenylalanyl-tRNA synthetase beta chain